MKIAIDASRYATDQPTGVELYSFEIINGLLQYFWPRKDHEILLYSPHDFHIQGAQSVNYRKRIIPFKRLWTQARLSLAMLTDRPDLLFVPSHVLPLIHPKKSIITIHDLAFRHTRHAYSFFQYHYLNWSTRFAVKRAARIIVPSGAVKNDLVKFYGCRSGKIEVIHHGFEERKEGLSSEAEREITDFLKIYDFDPDSDHFMLFIGRLETKKNLERLIKAFLQFSAHHPAWKLIIAGKPGIGYKKIRNLFFKLNLEGKVILPGYITDHEKQFLSERCRFFILPSLQEGFGLPVLSAFFHKKPIILSDIPIFHEIADQAAIYVDPYDEKAISHAMLELAADAKKCKMLTGKGLDRLRFFSWKKAAGETGRAIESFLTC